jgi:hypothetical protein
MALQSWEYAGGATVIPITTAKRQSPLARAIANAKIFFILTSLYAA